MARRFLLEFEKPLVELENQIDQIRELARDSEVDVSQQLLQLETLAARRREEIASEFYPSGRVNEGEGGSEAAKRDPENGSARPPRLGSLSKSTYYI